MARDLLNIVSDKALSQVCAWKHRAKHRRLSVQNHLTLEKGVDLFFKTD